MSTILKALRRLEEESSAQSQRPLREEVTRSPSSAKSRSGGWPLLVALLGLGVAAGAGVFVFWYLGGAPEPAQPTELAAAGSTEPRAEPSAAALRPRKPRGAEPARRRSSPSPAAVPSAVSEHELPAAALASKVEVMRRPPAQPRIAAPEPAEPQASEPARTALAPSIAAQREAPEPSGGAPAPAGADASATSLVATATPVQEVRRRAPEPPEPRAEQPREAASEPVVVAVAPREREPAEAASSEILRAEIPGLRVERTVWHPIAERRVALIEFERSAERREIREGDAVGPLVVSKIEPSGVVFVHEGVEVRRRIGE